MSKRWQRFSSRTATQFNGNIHDCYYMYVWILVWRLDFSLCFWIFVKIELVVADPCPLLVVNVTHIVLIYAMSDSQRTTWRNT